MKHCILVKFKENFDLNIELDNIKNIFNSIGVDGIHSVEYFCSCTNKPNRYDLLIRIDMDQESLEEYDKSEAHQNWKNKYSKFIELKTIFDYL